MSVVTIMICFIFATFLLVPRVRTEIGNDDFVEQMSIQDIFDKDGQFYVYLFKDNCPYCDNISEDIKLFEQEKKVFLMNADYVEELKAYDWVEHEKNYDIEIGENTETGEIKFYNNLNKEEIVKEYPAFEYKIMLIDQHYAEIHLDKEVGKIYAVATHPQLLEEDLQENNFVLPGVPLLVEFNNHRIVNFYFDDKEIISFLNSSTKPTDSYWNLNEFIN